MGLALRAGVSFCVAGGRVVIFDLPNCRYSGLDDAADEAFQALAATDSNGSRSPALGPLIQSGLLVESDDGSTAFNPTPPFQADGSLFDHQAPYSSWPRAWLAAMAQVKAALALGVFSLDRNLRNLARLKAKTCKSVDKSMMDRAAEVAYAFIKSELIISSGDKCLRRSLALARALLKLGIPCSLVIGVRMRPFAAHAWVQAGELVMNERLEEVRRYTTLMVI